MIPKFRAWHKEMKVMCEVAEIHLFTEMVSLVTPQQSVVNCYFHEVELMQSTRLFDINDVEIFEGDIVMIDAHSEPESPKIITRVLGGGFTAMTKGIPFNWFNFAKIGGGEFTPKIIGNIYENPELLEQST